jgi:hypothetical protein
VENFLAEQATLKKKSIKRSVGESSKSPKNKKEGLINFFNYLKQIFFREKFLI